MYPQNYYTPEQHYLFVGSFIMIIIVVICLFALFYLSYNLNDEIESEPEANCDDDCVTYNYACTNCNHVFAIKRHQEIIICPHCHNHE